MNAKYLEIKFDDPCYRIKGIEVICVRTKTVECNEETAHKFLIL